jgi:hypothetical protein
MKEQPMSDEKPMGEVIQIDEARIRDHLGEMVRGTVEETLNVILDGEAEQLCGAGRYECNQTGQDTRAGSYERTLHTSAGEVNLKIPKLRCLAIGQTDKAKRPQPISLSSDREVNRKNPDFFDSIDPKRKSHPALNR